MTQNIKKVFYCEDYESEESMKCLRQSGVECKQIPMNLVNVARCDPDDLESYFVRGMFILNNYFFRK